MKYWFAFVASALGLLPLCGGTLVQIRTMYGDLEFELLEDLKPITTANFLRYVHAGAYEGSIFHRQSTNFVIQGGGIRVINQNTTNINFEVIPTYPPITNEFRFGPEIGNTAGTLAMAKTRDPNSATSQFFINLRDNRSSLNDPANSGGFTVFGRLVSGTNALKILNSFQHSRPPNQPLTNLVVRLGVFGPTRFPLEELPLSLLYVNTNGQFEVRFEDLIYTDITTLKVTVDPLPTGGRQISWNGKKEGTNTVEFTTVFPPQWQTLTNVVFPTEERPTVVDLNQDSKRFYRVRTTFPPTGL